MILYAFFGYFLQIGYFIMRTPSSAAGYENRTKSSIFCFWPREAIHNGDFRGLGTNFFCGVSNWP